MFRSANDVVAGDDSVMEAGHLSDIVGQVRTVVGSAHLIRTSGVNAQIYVGISVCQGDVVVTGDDSSVGILFADGTAFNLASSSRLVLDEFVCDPDGSLNSGLLSVLQGAFSFIAGSKRQSSRLSIRTPFSTVRSAGRGGGIGTLTLAAFTFAIIKELQALPDEAAFLDYDLIPFDDLAGGAFTVTTKEPNPRTFIVDNPGVTLVIRGGSGSTFIAEQSANSALRMAELQAASRDAFAIFSQGQLDPITGGWRKAAMGSGGSGDVTGNTLLLYDYTQHNVGVFTPTTLRSNGFEPGGANPLIQTPVQKLSIDKVTLGEAPGVTGSSTLITASGELTFSGLIINAISASFVSAAWAGGSLPSGLASILGSAFSTLSPGVNSVGVNFSIVDKNLDFLAAGEPLTLTYNVTVNNGQATTPFVIGIVGANDQPTVAVGIGDSVSKSLTDGNAALTAGGTISVNDIDLSDQLTPVVSDVVLTGTIGNLTKGDVLGLLTVGPGFIAANPGDSNNLNWAFNSSAQTFDQLADGEILTLTYIVTAFDNHGGAVSQLVTITITGIEDAPFITAAVSSGAVEEDALPTSVSGVIAFVDFDLTNTHTVSATPAAGGYLGTFTPIISDAATGDGSGQVLWNFTVNNAALQFLAEGQTRTQTYTVTITDSAGTPATQIVTVTITGDEDAPTITAAVDSGAVTENVTTVANGTIDFADVDLTDSHTVGATPAAGGYLGTFTPSITNNSTGDGAGQVSWNFTVDNAALQFLTGGQTLTQIYTVSVSDGFGGTATQTVTITIFGTNDGPIVAATDVTGGVTELVIPVGNLTDFGTIAFSDDDLTDDHSVSAVTASAGALGSLTASVTTQASDVDGTGGVITWNYSVAASAVEFLAAGETKVETFTFNVLDGHGGSTQRTVTVTITGTNDAPIIAGELFTGGVAELGSNVDTGSIGTSGTFNFDDADLTDTHNVSFVPVGTTLGTLSVLSITDSATGAGPGTVSWTYTVNAAAVAAYLAVGETKVEDFTVTVTDINGAPLNDTATVRVTITGSNDTPIITAAVDSGAVTENGTTVANGTIDFADVDLTDSHTVGATPAAGGYLGTFTPSITNNSTGDGAGQVSWNFTVDNAALQFLTGGQTLTQIYTVSVSDGFGGTATQTVTITIFGTNDGPIVAATDVTGDVTELVIPVGNLTDFGTIAFSDVDLTDDHSVSAVTASAGALGSLTASVTTQASDVDGTGGVITWNYSVAASAVEFLAAGETKVETFTFNVLDGHGGSTQRTVTVTITGTNDAPIIAGELFTGGVAELGSNVDTGSIGTSGTFNFDDADLTDTHNVSFVPVGTTLGTLSVLSITDPATGAGPGTVSWTYTVNAAAVAAYLAVGETKVEDFTVTVTDINGAPLNDTATVRVTITGSNDAPIIAGELFTGGVAELGSNVDTGPIGTSGTFNFDDADLIDTHNVSFVPVGTTLGTLSVLSITDPATGAGPGTVSWTYTVTAAAVAYLAVGETKVEEFTVTVTDINGAPLNDTATVRVTITGSNDAPIVAATDVTGGVTELVIPVGNLTDFGTIAFSDVDLTDVHSVSAVTASAGTLGSLTASVTTQASDVDGTGGVITWNYSVAASAVEFLAAGETKVETFTFNVLDGHGGSVERTVTLTITGTHDDVDGPDGVNFTLATGENTAANNTGNLKGGDAVGAFTAFGDQDPTPITYTLGTNSSSHFIINAAVVSLRLPTIRTQVCIKSQSLHRMPLVIRHLQIFRFGSARTAIPLSRQRYLAIILMRSSHSE